MKAFFTSFILAACLYAGIAEAQAAGCGKVSIAKMRWGSAAIAASFDKYILEKGYGCSVTIVDGDTLPTLASMSGSGTPDIASEFWVKAVKPQLDAAISAGRLVKGAEILADGAVEGWWQDLSARIKRARAARLPADAPAALAEAAGVSRT